ncbi:uncharacterized protein LOC108735622 [Agrilus planipennis]|uniref:Uncharacterized protein LOC108735622 n=1 Tax=Agrilus planipennis TaxID=224129 RepID=A0A7F5R561_AGRPL|nr:uncharacterized protein LOC108735622 [Agrilus planipennis]
MYPNIQNQLPSPTSQAPQPVYKASEASSYVPHATYPYSDSYGPLDGYIVPALQYGFGPSSLEDKNQGIITPGQALLQSALGILSKVGLFLVGGVVLLIVGGIFHSLACSVSQLCTISYNGFGGIDKDSVRALMTPERVARAAVFLQDAVEKYERIQKGGKN